MILSKGNYIQKNYPKFKQNYEYFLFNKYIKNNKIKI